MELTYYNKTSFSSTDCWEDWLLFFFFFLKNVIELKCTEMMWQKEHCIESQKTWFTGLWLKSSKAYIIHCWYPFLSGTDSGVQIEPLIEFPEEQPWDQDVD